jgi:hypothetical protein
MADDYVVQDGDSIPSIAKTHGYLWKALWEHPKNADLKKLRKDPNVLLAGDVVHLPDPEPKEETRATGSRHKFVRKGEPTKLKLQLTRLGKPRANEKYTLVVDGTKIEGTTNGNGEIEQLIPGNSRQAKLQLKGGKEEYALKIGHLDPPDEISGVQQRLRNLGYDCADENGQIGPATTEALKAFQAQHGLPVTGAINSMTVDKLKEQHR